MAGALGPSDMLENSLGAPTAENMAAMGWGIRSPAARRPARSPCAPPTKSRCRPGRLVAPRPWNGDWSALTLHPRAHQGDQAGHRSHNDYALPLGQEPARETFQLVRRQSHRRDKANMEMIVMIGPGLDPGSSWIVEEDVTNPEYTVGSNEVYELLRQGTRILRRLVLSWLLTAIVPH